MGSTTRIFLREVLKSRAVRSVSAQARRRLRLALRASRAVAPVSMNDRLGQPLHWNPCGQLVRRLSCISERGDYHRGADLR